MKINFKMLTVIILSVLFISFIITGCGQQSKAPAEKTETEAVSENHAGHDHEMGDLSWVFTAENLYHCTQHPDILSDKEGVCKAEGCGMALVAMSDEEMNKLRDSNPKGCPMCHVIVTGDNEMTKCPHCGMDMVSAEVHEEPMENTTTEENLGT